MHFRIDPPTQHRNFAENNSLTIIFQAMKRANITIKAKWCEILATQSAALRGEVYNAVIEYLVTGAVVEMSEAAGVAFAFIRHEIDAAAAACARRRASCKASVPAPSPAEPTKPAEPAEPSEPSAPSEPTAPSKDCKDPEITGRSPISSSELVKQIFSPGRFADTSSMNVLPVRRKVRPELFQQHHTYHRTQRRG